jgi:hypothetical protein
MGFGVRGQSEFRHLLRFESNGSDKTRIDPFGWFPFGWFIGSRLVLGWSLL